MERELEEIDTIGKPLYHEGQGSVEFDANSLKDYVFKFDFARAPEFEVVGADKSSEFEIFKIEIPEEEVDKQLEDFRKTYGESVKLEENFGEDDDRITFTVEELDGDEVKTNGVNSTFSILFKEIADEDLKNELKAKKAGDAVRFNIFKLQKEMDSAEVKTALLNFSKDDIANERETGEMYKALIDSVTRTTPADLNQDFFNRIFGEGDVSNEEEARARIKEYEAQRFQGNANDILLRKMRDQLIALNKDNMPLPDDFLKRWVKSNYADKAEGILSDYEAFADDTRWTLIKGKLLKRYDINVEEQELRNHAYQKISAYFGGYGDTKMLEPLVNNMLNDRDQSYQLITELLLGRLLVKLKEEVTLKEVPISNEKFRKEYYEFFKTPESGVDIDKFLSDDEVELEEE